MDRLKTLGKYALWVILFFFFSNILIFIGLNSSYSNLSAGSSSGAGRSSVSGTGTDTGTGTGSEAGAGDSTIPPQVNVTQAQATAVNGRIRGNLSNDGIEDLKGKYMKVDLFSPKNVLLGTEYLSVDDIMNNGNNEFDLNFKAQDVDHYGISFVDKIEKVNNDLFNVKFLKRPLTSYEIVGLLIALALLG